MDTVRKDVASRRDRLGRRSRLAWLLLALGGLLALWLVFRHWAQPPSPSPPELDLTGADPLFVQRYETSREVVLRHPQSGEAWGELGTLLLAHQFFDETTLCLARAHELSPREFRWPYLLGIHLAVVDMAEAERYFRRALALAPQEAIAHARLGELLLGLERYDEALSHLEATLAIEPGNLRARVALARLHFVQGDLAAALSALNEVVQIAPQARRVRELRAQILQRSGRREEAERELQTVEQLPDDSLSWEDPIAAAVVALRKDAHEIVDRAQSLAAEGRLDEATRLLVELLRHNQRDPAPACVLARLYMRQKQYPQAMEILDQARQRYPLSAEVWFQSGVIRFLQEDYSQAASFFQNAIERKPDYALAHYNLGHTRRKLGDDAGALDAFRRTVQYRPVYVEAHINLARLLIERGDAQTAHKHLATVLELVPGHPEATQILRSLGAGAG